MVQIFDNLVSGAAGFFFSIPEAERIEKNGRGEWI
jgi:hypothetical protein